MFCAFAGAPRVLRLHGRGEVIEQRDRRYDELLERFELDDEMSAAARAAVRIDVTRISESCGFGVPLTDYQRERRQLFKTAAAWVRKNGPTAIRDYCNRNNMESVMVSPDFSRLTMPWQPEHTHTKAANSKRVGV